MSNDARLTVAHVTHEAVEKIGGIGTVLEGMMSSPVYLDSVRRSILVGPMGGHHFESPMRRFGEHGCVYYSTPDHIDPNGLSRLFHPIERAFGVQIAYGRRPFVDAGSGRTGEAEVLLFDVSNPSRDALNDFKTRLWREFGIDAARFEGDWGFEEYCRLAEPAFYAISALLDQDELPCIVVSHEFMGMCTALKTVLDGGTAFRTVFHAHECATARNLVENHAGHDTSFYNILRSARADDLFVEDVFGDQSGVMRHVLISRAHRLDAIAAVGDPTAEEMRFLNRETLEGRVEIVYNGIPELPTDSESKERSRNLMLDWSERTVGYRPDYLMTHVTRPVVSKGMWRDLKVAAAMAPRLKERGKKAILVILTCGAPPRRSKDVEKMVQAHNWPRKHVEGYPDLVGPEVWINAMIEPFNKTFDAMQVVLVNQFGWSRDLVGPNVPADMTFVDFRRATDVEFGQSTYEPFGIAQLEPLAAGAICVPSSICGCVASWRHVLQRLNQSEGDCRNVLVADYTQLDGLSNRREDLLKMTQPQRDQLEEQVAERIADELLNRLPDSPEERAALIRSGQECAHLMSWDEVIEDGLLPLFRSIVQTVE